MSLGLVGSLSKELGMLRTWATPVLGPVNHAEQLPGPEIVTEEKNSEGSVPVLDITWMLSSNGWDRCHPCSKSIHNTTGITTVLRDATQVCLSGSIALAPAQPLRRDDETSRTILMWPKTENLTSSSKMLLQTITEYMCPTESSTKIRRTWSPQQWRPPGCIFFEMPDDEWTSRRCWRQSRRLSYPRIRQTESETNRSRPPKARGTLSGNGFIRIETPWHCKAREAITDLQGRQERSLCHKRTDLNDFFFNTFTFIWNEGAFGNSATSLTARQKPMGRTCHIVLWFALWIFCFLFNV